MSENRFQVPTVDQQLFLDLLQREISSLYNLPSCKHCHQPISDDEYATHLAGNYRGKMRCDPEDSGLPYGYNAEPTDSECKSPCMGTSK